MTEKPEEVEITFMLFDLDRVIREYMRDTHHMADVADHPNALPRMLGHYIDTSKGRLIVEVLHAKGDTP